MGDCGSSFHCQRQARLDADQFLHLAFFIATQYERMLWWIQEHVYNLPEPFEKSWMTRYIDRLEGVRLGPLFLLYRRDCRGAGTNRFGHALRALARWIFRQFLRRQFDDVPMIYNRRTTATRQIFLDGLQAALGMALTPAVYLHATNVQLRSNLLILQTCCCQQHDFGTPDQVDAGGVGTSQLFKGYRLTVAQYNFRGNTHLKAPAMGHNHMTEKHQANYIDYANLY
jgi:hypothetical protein